MPAGGVELPVAKCQQLADLGDLEIGRQHARAAQYRLDARQQLPRGKGLCQIVVCAHLQADDAVGFVASGRQHQDWCRLVLAGAQFAAQDQSIIARHHHIENDEIDGVRLEKCPHMPAVGSHGDPQAILLQITRNQFPDFAIVIDDQDVVDMIHRAMPSIYWSHYISRHFSRAGEGLAEKL